MGILQIVQPLTLPIEFCLMKTHYYSLVNVKKHTGSILHIQLCRHLILYSLIVFGPVPNDELDVHQPTVIK